MLHAKFQDHRAILVTTHNIYRQGDSSEYPQQMFLLRNKQNYPQIILKYPPYLFHCVDVVAI